MNYENETRLQESHVVGAVSVTTMRNALLEAEAALAQAKAQETTARNNLSYTEVKSPANGVTSMIPWHVGSLVSSTISEPLVTVADDSEVYAYFSITENQELDLVSRYGSVAAFISEAPAVTLRLSNGRDYPSEGRISAVSGTVDTPTGAVTLRATFPNPAICCTMAAAPPSLCLRTARTASSFRRRQRMNCRTARLSIVSSTARRKPPP